MILCRLKTKFHDESTIFQYFCYVSQMVHFLLLEVFHHRYQILSVQCANKVRTMLLDFTIYFILSWDDTAQKGGSIYEIPMVFSIHWNVIHGFTSYHSRIIDSSFFVCLFDSWTLRDFSSNLISEIRSIFLPAPSNVRGNAAVLNDRSSLISTKFDGTAKRSSWKSRAGWRFVLLPLPSVILVTIFCACYFREYSFLCNLLMISRPMSINLSTLNKISATCRPLLFTFIQA